MQNKSFTKPKRYFLIIFQLHDILKLQNNKNKKKENVNK